MKKPNITEGEWEVKKWDGEKWPEKRISLGQKNGRQFCIAISPRYADDEQVYKDFKAMSATHDLIDALIDCVKDLRFAKGETYDEAHAIGMAKSIKKGEQALIKAGVTE